MLRSNQLSYITASRIIAGLAQPFSVRPVKSSAKARPVWFATQCGIRMADLIFLASVRAQRCVKVGLRLFKNASMPSVWSLVAKVAWNSRRSNIRPSLNELSNARFTASLAAITAIWP